MPIIIDAGSFAAWSLLNQEAITFVAGCPVFLVETEVKAAAREFLRRSTAWRDRKVDLLTTVADEDEYAYDLPANAELNRVHVAWNGTTEVDVQVPGEEDDSETADTDTEWMIGVLEGGQGFRLTPAASTAGVELTGTVSYVTATNAAGIPQWIYDEWHYGIACGAAARLLKQVSRPWSNPQASVMLQEQFDVAIREASNRAGPVTRRPLRVRPAS
jgi:hypothetical protein